MKNSPFVAAILGCVFAAGGCAMQAAAPAPQASLYDRLGGAPAISALVDDGLANIAADSRINRRFASTSIERLHRNMVELVCARTGGPCVYSGRNMADAHEGMYITDAEFDALVQDLVRSFDKFKVPVREQGELLAALGRMRNAVVGH